MELTVLGSSAAWPDAGLAASGYLLREDDFTAVLDLGTGVMSNLQLHVPHERLDAVIITHSHIDHCIDLHPLYMARLFHPEPLPPLPLYAPPGVFDRVAGLEDADGQAEMRKLFDVHEVEPGGEFEAGPLRVSTRLLPHWVPNAGLRIQADGRVLVYTGDTGPSDEVEALARDADLVVAEASWQPEQAEGRPPFHLTAGQAARHASRAGAGRLVLSHFWPGADRNASREEAAAEFDGELVIAREGMRLEVDT